MAGETAGPSVSSPSGEHLTLRGTAGTRTTSPGRQLALGPQFREEVIWGEPLEI